MVIGFVDYGNVGTNYHVRRASIVDMNGNLDVNGNVNINLNVMVYGVCSNVETMNVNVE
jgi:hypothetical protein